MSDRKYYVICEDKCLFEGMTKEQILAAIEQAISTGKIRDVDTGFVTKIKEQNSGAALSFWVGTSAEYNALTEKQNNCFYIITDDTSGADIKTAIEALQTAVSGLDERMNKINTPTVLWQGAINKNSTDAEKTLNIPNLSKYNLFALEIGKSGVSDILVTTIIAYKQCPIGVYDEEADAMLFGGNSYSYGDQNSTATCTLTIKDNVATFIKATAEIGTDISDTFYLRKIIGIA